MPRQQTTSSTATQPLLYLNLRPFYLAGLFAVLFAGPFMRGLFFPAEQLTAQLIISAAFVFCLGDYLLRRERLRTQPQDWAMLALVAAYALSLLTALHLRPAVGEVLEMAAVLMVYVMAARACDGERALDRLLVVIYAAACGVAIIGLLAATGVFNFPGAYASGRITSTLQYANALAIYLVVASLLGLGLSVKASALWPKLILAAGNVLLIAIILGTQSRGGWILYPLAVGAYLALLPVCYRWRAAYHFLIALGAALVFSRPLYAAIKVGEPRAALFWLAAAVLCGLLLQAGYHFLGRWLNRPQIEENTRRLVAMGGLVYCLAVGGLYLLYAGGAFPTAAAGLLPGQVVQRAGEISGADPSFQSRLEYSRYAVSIAMDHPLTGTGGGGWNAIYHQYQDRLSWTTEVHNHFFQVWVEAGTLGLLALLALWVFAVRGAWRFYRRAARDGLWVSFFALAVAVAALGVHSAWDFDLSIPALGFTLYAGLGALRGLAPAADGASAPDAPASAGPTTNSRRAHKHRVAPAPGPAPQQPDAPTSRRRALTAVGVLAALALAAVVAWPSYRFYQAGVIGAQGARAIQAQDLAAAEQHLQQARRLDPYTASYAADLAQLYAVRARAEDDAVSHYRALEEARAAARLAPYDPRIAAALTNVYGMIREPHLAVEEARRLLQGNPLLVSNYEMFGRVLLSATVKSLRNGDTEQAAACLREAEQLPTEMAAHVRPAPSSNSPSSTPALELVLGQAACLRHDPAADSHLAAAAREASLQPEACLWQAVAAHYAGREDEVQRLLHDLTQQNPAAERAYRELIALPPLP